MATASAETMSLGLPEGSKQAMLLKDETTQESQKQPQLTGRAIMNGSGQPRSGVDVKFFRKYAGSGMLDTRVLIQLQTDMNGYFHLNNLADGTYEIRLSSDDVVGDFPYELVIENGLPPKRNIEIGLDPVLLIGQILQVDGSPVTGAYVTYGVNGGSRYTADTDEKGTYRVTILSEGEANSLYFYMDNKSSEAEPDAKWNFVYKGDRIQAPYLVVNGNTAKLQEPSTLPLLFTDIQGHWAKETIKRAITANLISGYPDQTFKPDRVISEAEFITLFLRAFQVQIPEAAGGKHWSSGAYKVASEYQFPVSLEKEGKQDTPINRMQAAEIITGANGLHFVGNDAIQYVLAKGYSTGKSAATIAGYQGEASLTRAEALQFIFNLTDKGMQQIKVRPASKSAKSQLPQLGS